MWSQLASIALALCSLSLVAAQRCVDQVHHEQQALSPRVDYAACGPAVCATDGYCYRLFHNICYLNAFNVRLLFAGQRALVQADIRHCLPEPRWLDYNTPYDPRLPGSSYVNAGAYETPYLYESEDLEPSYPRSYAPYLYYKAQDTYSPINGFYYRNMREYVTQRKPKPSTSYRKPKAKCTTTASPITASTTTSTTTASTAAPSTTSTTVATTTPSTTSTTTASTTTPSTTSTTVSTTTPSTTSTTVSTTTPSTTSTTTSSTTTPSTTSTTAASTTTASTSTVSTTTPSTTSPSTTSTTTPSTTSTTTPSTTPITIASTTPSTTTVTTTTASTTPPTTIASTPPTTTILSLLQSAAGAAQSPIPSTTNLPDILSTTQSTTATTATSPQTTLTTSSSVTTASTVNTTVATTIASTITSTINFVLQSSTPPATTASTAAPTTASIDLDDNTLVSLVFTMPNGRVFRLSMASQITDPTTGNKTCAEETQLELRYRGISEPLRFTGCIYNNSTRNGTSYGTTTTRRPTPKPYYSPSRSVDYRPVGYLYSITYGSAYEAPYASGPAPPQYRADPAPPRYGYGPRPGNTRFRVHASASASADLPYYD
ncbi:cell wall protein DAN4-like [Drosophila navojoa]|uniref:cell wall protein DAN4-like n=1 Tax=Drosophila navojoa TaxID=7232 RepID=UPI0011BFB748|nr:cell wall protein DAN4-like [Drosophila navojoa]